MRIRIEADSAGFPLGEHVGRLQGVEATGASLEWTFAISGGSHQGQLVRARTPATCTLSNACGRLLAALTGTPLVCGDAIDVGDLIGKEALLVMTEDDAGNARLGEVRARAGT